MCALWLALGAPVYRPYLGLAGVTEEEAVMVDPPPPKVLDSDETQQLRIVPYFPSPLGTEENKHRLQQNCQLERFQPPQ